MSELALVSVMRVLVRAKTFRHGNPVFTTGEVDDILNTFLMGDDAAIFRMVRGAVTVEQAAALVEAVIVRGATQENLISNFAGLAAGDHDGQVFEEASLGCVLGLFRAAVRPDMSTPVEKRFEELFVQHLWRIIFSGNPHLDKPLGRSLEGELTNLVSQWVKGSAYSHARRTEQIQTLFLLCSSTLERQRETHELARQCDPQAQPYQLPVVGAWFLNKICDAMWYAKSPIEKLGNLYTS